MVPPAPALFSTRTVWPSVGRMASASERATLSVGPPAENGTTRVTGFEGKSAACAGLRAARDRAAAPAETRAASLRGVGRMGGLLDKEGYGATVFDCLAC